ncbi:MAG: hypothetical protein JNK58_13095 [Phycisphaerae bacterium]|nr:hypothetical protein [Phycisphaerae bacterium]
MLYVNATAAPGGTGLSWSSAFPRLETALATAAGSGGMFNEIWVAQGVYRPDGGSGDRSATFLLFSGAVIRGGFAGSETTLGQRVPGAFPTVLSGDIGTPNDSADNSFHVVSMRVLVAPALIDGFTIRDGRADGGSFPNNSGGGLLNEGTTLVTDCVFEQNFAVSGGGALSRFGAGTFVNCHFVSNSASSEGGALYIRDGGGATSCVFSGNNSAFGGALWTCCGTIKVSDCAFTSNFGNFGGALFNSSGSLVLKRSMFFGNSASRGGAIHSGTNAWIVNCCFAGNSGDRGGAIYANAAGNLVNCVFTRNFALSSGGAVWAASSLNLSSSTLHGNNALLFGGGLYCESGMTNVNNSILWSNTDNTGSGQSSQITRVGGSLWTNYNCIKGWTGSLGGSGNTGSPPQFVDPAGADGLPGTLDDNFRLLDSSPCIDTGSTGHVLADSADINDNGNIVEPTPLDYDLAPRVIEHLFCPPNGPPAAPLIDMGAFEFVPPPRVMGDADGDGNVDFADITTVLAGWGMTLVPADVNDSGAVDFSDVTTVLANWGNTARSGGFAE